MQPSPLRAAVVSNNLQAVTDAMNAGHTPFNASHTSFSTPHTPFDLAHIAVENNDRTSKLILELLLLSGCSATTTNSSGDTLLTLACEMDRCMSIPTLCKAGADVNVVSRNGMTPLGHMVQNGNAEMVKYLVTHGAEVNKVCPSEGCTPMAIVTMPSLTTRKKSKKAARLEIYKYLRENGGQECFTQYSTDRDLLLPNGQDVLQIACLCNDAAKVRRFIEHGAPFDVARSDGLTPLIIASTSGFDRIVKMLLSYGSSLYMEDVHFQTVKHALKMACAMRHFNVSAMLMEVIMKKEPSQLSS
jgi:ankyrin repeat protein